VSSRRPASRARNAILFRKDWRVESVGGKDFGRRGRSIVRGVFVARLRKGDARLSVASSHLGLDPDERARHAVELLQGLESLAEPLVLGADLNEQSRAAAAAMKRIAGRYVDVFARVGKGPGETLPSYQQRIDHLFVSRDVTPVRAWVPSGPDVDRASDHRPVVADLDVPD
jgi:endonuclease/exonuclease/phosphatase family metal-dependent hydrolase